MCVNRAGPDTDLKSRRGESATYMHTETPHRFVSLLDAMPCVAIINYSRRFSGTGLWHCHAGGSQQGKHFPLHIYLWEH